MELEYSSIECLYSAVYSAFLSLETLGLICNKPSHKRQKNYQLCSG